MTVEFERGKIFLSSVKISKGNQFRLSSPSLKLSFEIRNDSGFDVELDRFFYKLRLSIGDWVPELGSDVFLHPWKIPMGSQVLDTYFMLNYETIKEIDGRMKTFSDNIIWEVSIEGYFVGPKGPFRIISSVEGGEQKDPWTPYSIWKVWLDYWNKRMPKPYEYVEKFDELNKKLEDRLSQLEETLITARSLIERLEKLAKAFER